jgi:hypothetical protein
VDECRPEAEQRYRACGRQDGDGDPLVWTKPKPPASRRALDRLIHDRMRGGHGRAYPTSTLVAS